MQYVYAVMKEVPYEGGTLLGLFNNRDSAKIFAERQCRDRIESNASNREPYYDMRDNGLEMFHDGDVEFWFYKEEVKD